MMPAASPADLATPVPVRMFVVEHGRVESVSAWNTLRRITTLADTSQHLVAFERDNEKGVSSWKFTGPADSLILALTGLAEREGPHHWRVGTYRADLP